VLESVLKLCMLSPFEAVIAGLLALAAAGRALAWLLSSPAAAPAQCQCACACDCAPGALVCPPAFAAVGAAAVLALGIVIGVLLAVSCCGRRSGGPLGLKEARRLYA